VEPQCAIGIAIEIAELVELGKRAIDGRASVLALLIEGALREPHIKIAASRMAGVSNALEHHLVAPLAKARAPCVFRIVPSGVTIESIEAKSEVNDIVATVCIATEGGVELIHERMVIGTLVLGVIHECRAVCQKHLARFVGRTAMLCHDAEKLEIALGDGVAEDIHLASMVVDVVLPLDIVASVLEHVTERVPEGCPAAVTDVKGAYGVGRDELDLVLRSPTEVRAAVVLALFANRPKDLVVRGGREIEVDEARACDLDSGKRRALWHVGHYRRGDPGWGHVGKACRSQRHRGRPVTVGGIGGSLDTELVDLERREVTGTPCIRDGLAKHRLNLIGHSLSHQGMLCGRTAPQVDSVSERARKLADRRTPGYDALLAREIVAEACKAELETHGIDLWVEEPNDGGIEMHDRLAAALACNHDALGLARATAVLHDALEKLPGFALEIIRRVCVEDVKHRVRRTCIHRIVHEHVSHGTAARIIETPYVLNAWDGALVGHLGKLDDGRPRLISRGTHGRELVDAAEGGLRITCGKLGAHAE